MTDGLVAGRFHIRGLLGSGGTASVFDADDVLSGRRVALKLLHPHLATERSVWDAFFEEVHAAQSIDHPGLAVIHDAGVEDSDPPIVWIAMERVQGVSLADHVREHGPLGVDAAVALASAVLDALTAAHRGGVVHRDITPANIMLDPDLMISPFDRDVFGRGIRLLDFGLADIPGRSTVGSDALLSAPPTPTSGVVASVPYASPEQLSAAPVGEASDLYQVGATLYFALTGRVPFAGGTSAVVRAHLSAPPPVPSARRKGLPHALDRVVATAMLKRPEDRYPDAAAMRSALNRALTGADLRASRAPADTDALTEARAVRDAGTVLEQTASTLVYRTNAPADRGPPPELARPAATPHRRGAWQPWAATAGLIAVLTAIVALSAMAASSPTPGASVAPSTAAVPSTVAEDPAVTDEPVVSVVVPGLTGLTLGEARAALERAGLVLGDVSSESSLASADTVLGSTPNQGQLLAAGSAVTVQVASGANTVPATVGLSPAEATAALTASGFPSYVADVADGAPGLVAGTSPAAGEAVQLGSTVIIYAVRPMTALPTPTPAPTATSTPVPTPTPTSAGGPGA